jgi:general secretion pathway protein G
MITNKHMNHPSFTLIEVMVVVVIIGILATIIVPRIMDRPGQARTQKAMNDIQTIGSALNLYKLDKFNYPTTNEGLESLMPEYLDKKPIDPWLRDYYYLSPGENGDFDLYSLGADNRIGGKDENTDISNWQ